MEHVTASEIVTVFQELVRRGFKAKVVSEAMGWLQYAPDGLRLEPLTEMCRTIRKIRRGPEGKYLDGPDMMLALLRAETERRNRTRRSRITSRQRRA